MSKINFCIFIISILVLHTDLCRGQTNSTTEVTTTHQDLFSQLVNFIFRGLIPTAINIYNFIQPLLDLVLPLTPVGPIWVGVRFFIQALLFVWNIFNSLFGSSK